MNWNQVGNAISGLSERAARIQEVPSALMTVEGWKKVWRGLCVGGGGAAGALVWCAVVDALDLPDLLKSGYLTPLIGAGIASLINLVRTYLRRFHVVVEIEG